MKRREMLVRTGAALVGMSAFPLHSVRAAEGKKPKVLYFTRSAGFEHSVVQRKGKELSYSEKIIKGWGDKYDIDVVCSKDGGVFDGDLDQFEAFLFYYHGRSDPADQGTRRAAHDPNGPEAVAGRHRRRQGLCRVPLRHRFVPLQGRKDHPLSRHARRRVRHPPKPAEGDDEGRLPQFPRAEERRRFLRHARRSGTP